MQIDEVHTVILAGVLCVAQLLTYALACRSASVKRMRVTAGNGSSLKEASSVSCKSTTTRD